LKNDVHVPLKEISIRNGRKKIIFLATRRSLTKREGSGPESQMCRSGYNPDPDPKHLVGTVADLTREGHNVGKL
jgi:hypothetical protein